MYSVRESLCFCKQKTAYEMRISDWSSDVCSSDLVVCGKAFVIQPKPFHDAGPKILQHHIRLQTQFARNGLAAIGLHVQSDRSFVAVGGIVGQRSEEHTSELQSLMRISYAVFCLKKKKQNNLQYT